MESVALERAEPNWAKAQELYGQGVAPVEIIRQCGISGHALNDRIHRFGWSQLRRAAQAAAREEISCRVRGALISSILRDSLRYERYEMPEPHTEEGDTASRVRARLIESAARLLSWDTLNDSLANIQSAKSIDI